LRLLRALWKKRLRPLGHVADNPWLDVPFPNTPKGKRVRVPEEGVVAEFFDWLDARYPKWELLRLFVKVKTLAGCRTFDLCQAKTADLSEGSLTLTAAVTKTKEPRTIPLLPEIAADLKRLAGPVWLWERSAEDSRKYRPHPSRRELLFRPSTWKWTVENIFREFNAGRSPASRLRPHDLRARAITVLVTATKNVDATAPAVGADPQTVRHYLNAAKAFDGMEVMRKAPTLLLPPGK
jgi:integrase